MKIRAQDYRVDHGRRVKLHKWPTLVKPAYRSKAHYERLLAGHVEHLEGVDHHGHRRPLHRDAAPREVVEALAAGVLRGVRGRDLHPLAHQAPARRLDLRHHLRFQLGGTLREDQRPAALHANDRVGVANLDAAGERADRVGEHLGGR